MKKLFFIIGLAIFFCATTVIWTCMNTDAEVAQTQQPSLFVTATLCNSTGIFSVPMAQSDQAFLKDRSALGTADTFIFEDDPVTIEARAAPEVPYIVSMFGEKIYNSNATKDKGAIAA